MHIILNCAGHSVVWMNKLEWLATVKREIKKPVIIILMLKHTVVIHRVYIFAQSIQNNIIEQK